MIVYLDASALVKRYISEAGSRETERLIERASAVATSVVSRAEVAAGLARAGRLRVISQNDAASALQVFRSQWPDYLRLQVTETLIARADALAWDQGLRGYDAVHLAAAIVWQETIGESVTLATFDRQLWSAGGRIGLTPWPATLA
ncbi:MAG: type II toxin-antitoxin system VapC family toxin [Nitrospirae bacterium]|nr:type II toxin-antitoxin system VapC family toxin [Nitrospirota bacterium]